MTDCEFPGCNKKEALPFKCKYCGKSFCTAHRLPENHNCDKLHLGESPIKIASVKEKPKIAKEEEDIPFVTYDFTDEESDFYYSVNENGEPIRVKQPKRKLSRRYSISQMGDAFTTGYEALDIFIGTLFIIISFGFTAIFMSSVPWIYSGIIVGIVLISYLSQILPQKLLVKRFGFESKYVLTWIGIIITLVTIISPFKYLGPGILLIPQIQFMQKKKAGIISSIGSIINVILGLITMFLGIFLSNPMLQSVFISGAFITSMLSIFNLIPFRFSLGRKVLDWHLAIYLTLLILSIGIFVVAILFGVLGFDIL